MDPKNMIKSVRKATAILSLLADSHEEALPLATIAASLGIPKPTCAHIIKTLEEDGFAVKISSAKGYVLGPAAYCLSRFGRYQGDLIELARPVMRYLYRHLGYTVVLAVLEGSEKYIVDYLDDGEMFGMGERILKDNIYRTATGRLILAHLPTDALRTVLEKHGMPTPSLWEEAATAEGFERELKALKTARIAKSRTLSSETVTLGYGAPIFKGTACVGAIGIAVKLDRRAEKDFADEEIKIRRLLTVGAKEIGAKLAAQGKKKQ